MRFFPLDDWPNAGSISCNDPTMIRHATALPGEVNAYAGELRGLLEQLGSPDENFAFIGVFPELRDVSTPAALQDFLTSYQSQILIPLELFAIHSAYNHMLRNECRELIALDQRLATETRLKNFASASKRVGHVHLKRFRP